MKGLELAKKFFLEEGEPFLKSEFTDEYADMAIGLVGHGSECFGFDDDASTDHDYDRGFCIWINENHYRKYGFGLERAYERLLKKTNVVPALKSARGYSFKGVRTIENFYSFYLGSATPPADIEKWLEIPDFYLAEATNGEVFYDEAGEFTRIREDILHGRPNDVRLKKLASELFYCAQFGQYNYSRCLKRGEISAANYCLSNFCIHAANAAFLIANRYAPYYKWVFKALESLPVFSGLKSDLEEISKSPLSADNTKKIDAVCKKLALQLDENGICFSDAKNGGDCYLERHAYLVNDKIKNHSLRNSPVML